MFVKYYVFITCMFLLRDMPIVMCIYLIQIHTFLLFNVLKREVSNVFLYIWTINYSYSYSYSYYMYSRTVKRCEFDNHFNTKTEVPIIACTIVFFSCFFLLLLKRRSCLKTVRLGEFPCSCYGPILSSVILWRRHDAFLDLDDLSAASEIS